jgi:hypothetical protein
VEPLDPLFVVGSSEWMITAAPLFGVDWFHSSPNNYILTSLSWGRVLSGPLGPGMLRGRFAWVIEAVPIFAQYSPDDVVGFGVTPLTWRWDFDPHGKVAPFAEIGGGFLFTNHPVPAETTSANFTAHGTFGLRYFFRSRQSLAVSYVFHHISNGNRLEQNPGVNAHGLQVGFSIMRPR